MAEVKAQAEAAKAKAEAEKVAAEKAAEEAAIKAENARKLVEAANAKKKQEEVASRVKEASAEEARLKQEAEMAAEAAKSATEAEEVEKLTKIAEEKTARARAASTITTKAIDESIEVTEKSNEVAQIMKAKVKEIDAQPWTAERIFALFDKDVTGELSRDEIVSALTAIKERVPTEEQLLDLYGKYDANGDGLFSMEELVQMMNDDLIKPKKIRRSVFKRNPKAAATPQEEKDKVKSIKEELMAKEIILTVEREAAVAIAAKESSEQAAKAAAEAKAKAAKVEEEHAAALSRQDKVIKDISDGVWSTARVFAAFDANHDNQLSVSELQLALSAILDRAVTASDAQKFSDKFDEDKDGAISFSEFETVVNHAEDHFSGFFGLFSSFGDPEDVDIAKSAVAKKENGE